MKGLVFPEVDLSEGEWIDYDEKVFDLTVGTETTTDLR